MEKSYSSWYMQMSWNMFQRLCRFMSKSVPEVVLIIGVLTNESMILGKKTVRVVCKSAPQLLRTLHFH
jgi:hypothetical protein